MGLPQSAVASLASSPARIVASACSLPPFCFVPSTPSSSLCRSFPVRQIHTIFNNFRPIKGILPLVPLLSANGKPYISLGGSKEPVEVDIGLAVLSLMQVSLFGFWFELGNLHKLADILQLAAAFSLLLYGCRAFGTTMKHVEQLRSAAIAAHLSAAQNGEAKGGDRKI